MTESLFCPLQSTAQHSTVWDERPIMKRAGLSLVCPLWTLGQRGRDKLHGGEKGNSGGKESANQVIAKI